jgi:hypothetical protein
MQRGAPVPGCTVPPLDLGALYNEGPRRRFHMSLEFQLIFFALYVTVTASSLFGTFRPWRR